MLSYLFFLKEKTTEKFLFVNNLKKYIYILKFHNNRANLLQKNYLINEDYFF